MDHDKLSQTIIDAYANKGYLLSAEVVVFRCTDNQVIRDTIVIDFSEDDYQYHTTVKPIYTE
jgi:hypothetical protein